MSVSARAKPNLSPNFDPWEPYAPGSDRLTLTSIEITVTHTCNLRCSYCAVGETLRPTDVHPLPLSLLLDRLDEVPTLTTLSLTGGEPSFLRETMEGLVLPLLRYAKRRGLYTQINTNLTLPYERYEPLLGLVDVVHTSLNAQDPMAFGKLAFGRRRAPGEAAQAELFHRILANMERLAEMGAFVSAETMLAPFTRPSLLAIHRLVADAGCRRQEIHPLYPVDFAAELPLLTRQELVAAIHELLDGRRPEVWLLFGTLPFFWCTADEAERSLLRRLRQEPNVTVRNDPDGRNRLNVNAFTGEVFVSDFVALGALGNVAESALPSLFERWLTSEAARDVLCRCPAVQCLGPNVLVRSAYYPDHTFRSGEGDAAYARSASDR